MINDNCFLQFIPFGIYNKNYKNGQLMNKNNLLLVKNISQTIKQKEKLRKVTQIRTNSDK